MRVFTWSSRSAIGSARSDLGDQDPRLAGGTLDRTFAPGRETTEAIFALGQIARVSGDRVRDLDESLRLEALARLEALGANEETLRPVREFHELEAAQQGQALGDALPTGLRLLAKDSVGS